MTSSSPFPIPISALKPISCGSVLWRSGGHLRATFIVKITLGLVHERTAWPTTPVDLVVEDRRRDANPLSSLVEAAENAPYLPNAGVVLFAHACAPQGRPVPALSARLALFRDRGLIDKTVHVFGERTANAPQHPRPFERVPLVYERTWGGPSSDDNPVGVSAGGSSLPSICDPTNATRAVGFGPVSRQWPARKRLLGSTDLARIEAPITDYPNGFDFRYFNPAPADQQIEYLRGDEWLVLDGMHPTLPRVQSRLPQMRGKACVFFVSTNAVTSSQVVDLVEDLVVVEADKMTVSVVFRGSLPLDSLDVLPRMRVFADVELPGNPTRWPETPEVLRAPAPAPLGVSTNPVPTPPAALAGTQPQRDESALRPAMPFQPKPPGAPTVVPFMTSAPPRPRIDLDEQDPLMRTFAADPEESALRPAMPFVGRTAAPAVAAPRVAPPPNPSTRRPADDEDATRAIDLDKLEAKRAATPFADAAGRPPNFETSDIRRAPAKVFDDDESTRAIDIEQLEAKRAAVTPFAATDVAKPPASVANPIPGSPWASPRPGSAAPPPRPAAFNIDDPLTRTADGQTITPLPFAQPVAPKAPVLSDVPTHAPPRVEAPPMVKPPAMIEPPAFVAPVNVPAPVAVAAPSPPPAIPKAVEPPPAPFVVPPVVSREEPRELPTPAAPIAPPTNVAPPAVATQVADESGIRATVLERIRSGVPAPLHGLSVAGADLSGLDLRGANLSGNDLGGAKLCKTNLSGARLGSARLVDAELEGADLSGADLAGADLTRATLTNARFVGANIDQANFSSAQGSGANFDGCKGRAALFVRGLWPSATFRGMDVMNADFTGATLDEAAFERAVLVEVKFNDVRGKGAKFDDARIEQAHGEGSSLTESSFRNVDAKGSTWENATLDGSSFDDARMENAVFVRASCREAKFVNANLRAANFGRAQGDTANLSGANLEGADFRQAKFCDGKFEGARLANVLAPRADFSRSNFSRADLSNGSLRAAQLGGANLAHAILDGADLRDADLKRSVLFKASRTGAKLSGANTKDAIETEPSE